MHSYGYWIQVEGLRVFKYPEKTNLGTLGRAQEGRAIRLEQWLAPQPMSEVIPTRVRWTNELTGGLVEWKRPERTLDPTQELQDISPWNPASAGTLEIVRMDDKDDETAVPTFDIAKDDSPSDEEGEDGQHPDTKGGKSKDEFSPGSLEQGSQTTQPASYGPTGIRPRKAGKYGTNRPY
jgi:hypothetical protein